MSIQNKPDYKVFASSAKSGEVETFPDILRGWGVTIDRTGEIPPMEWFNAIGKRVDEWLLYLTQRGIPEWDASIDYPKTAMVQYAGIYYVSLKATKGERPNTTQAAWSTLSAFLGLGNYYSKAESDTKFQGKGDYVDKTATGEQGIKSTLAVNSAIYVTSAGVDSDLLAITTLDGVFGFRKRINSTYGGTVEVPYQGGTIALVEQTIGINQTWKNLTGSRKTGTTYTNSSGKPILVALTGQGEGDNSAKITVDNVTIAILGGIRLYSIIRGVSFIVPPGSKYLVESTAVITAWSELS